MKTMSNNPSTQEPAEHSPCLFVIPSSSTSVEITREFLGKSVSRFIGAVGDNRGFTFAETLAAMLFMAIVVPVMVQGMTVANRVGIAAERQREAVELADRLLTELVLTDEWRDSERDGDFGEDWPGYRWVLSDDTWEADTMRVVSVQVFFKVQGRELSIELTTLADEAEL